MRSEAISSNRNCKVAVVVLVESDNKDAPVAGRWKLGELESCIAVITPPLESMRYLMLRLTQTLFLTLSTTQLIVSLSLGQG